LPAMPHRQIFETIDGEPFLLRRVECNSNNQRFAAAWQDSQGQKSVRTSYCVRR
jgi:hypothetical protein